MAGDLEGLLEEGGDVGVGGAGLALGLAGAAEEGEELIAHQQHAPRPEPPEGWGGGKWIGVGD